MRPDDDKKNEKSIANPLKRKLVDTGVSKLRDTSNNNRSVDNKENQQSRVNMNNIVS